jgi:hypothetical protein
MKSEIKTDTVRTKNSNTHHIEIHHHRPRTGTGTNQYQETDMVLKTTEQPPSYSQKLRRQRRKEIL